MTASDHTTTVGHPRDPRLNPDMAKKVAKARERWDARGTGKYNSRTVVALSFDEMLDSLLDTCLRYSNIAVACGVSRERVRQIHRDFFSSILPYRAQRKRESVCRIVRHAMRRSELQPVGLAAKFAEEARRHGVDVAAVTWDSSTEFKASSKSVRVGRAKINLHFSGCPCIFGQRGQTRRFRFFVTDRSPNFIAFFCGDPLKSWFIIPTELLAGRYNLYIPEKPCTYAQAMGRTDWLWQYRDAFHLLKAEDR